jgi:hypothetical protein
LKVGKLIFEQEFLFLGIGEDPSSVLVSFLVLDELKVLFFPDLFDLVEFFFVLKLLNGFIDDFEYCFFVFLEIKGKNLIQSHGFDGDFKGVAGLSHEFLPMSVGDGTVLKLNDKRNGVLKGKNLFIELVVDDVSAVLLTEFSFEGVEEFIEDFLELVGVELDPQSG